MKNLALSARDIVTGDLWVYWKLGRPRVAAQIKCLTKGDSFETYSSDIRMALPVENLTEYLQSEISWRRSSLEDKAKVQFQISTFMGTAMFLGTPFIFNFSDLTHNLFVFVIVSLVFSLLFLLIGIILAMQAFRVSNVALLSLEEQTQDCLKVKQLLLQAIDLNELYLREKANITYVSSNCIRNGLVLFVLTFIWTFCFGR